MLSTRFRSEEDFNKRVSSVLSTCQTCAGHNPEDKQTKKEMRSHGVFFHKASDQLCAGIICSVHTVCLYYKHTVMPGGEVFVWVVNKSILISPFLTTGQKTNIRISVVSCFTYLEKDISAIV